jgi:hypothetical protein
VPDARPRPDTSVNQPDADLNEPDADLGKPDADSNQADADTSQPDATPGITTDHINLNGPLHTGVDFAGTWRADASNAVCNGVMRNITDPIFGTVDDPLFQNYAYAGGANNMTCTVGGGMLQDGDYTITLLFAEAFCNGPGTRVFDVALEGQTVLTDFDVNVVTGCVISNAAAAPVSRVFTNVAVSDGTLNVSLISVTGGPVISAIALQLE